MRGLLVVVLVATVTVPARATGGPGCSIGSHCPANAPGIIVTALTDIAGFTPILRRLARPQGGSSGHYFARGVGQLDFIASTDPGVGVYPRRRARRTRERL